MSTFRSKIINIEHLYFGGLKTIFVFILKLTVRHARLVLSLKRAPRHGSNAKEAGDEVTSLNHRNSTPVNELHIQGWPVPVTAGFTPSGSFGFLPVEENNGFDRSTTGLPTTDVETVPLPCTQPYSVLTYST